MKYIHLHHGNNQSHEAPINLPRAKHRYFVYTFLYHFDKFNVYINIVINRI